MMCPAENASKLHSQEMCRELLGCFPELQTTGWPGKSRQVWAEARQPAILNFRLLAVRLGKLGESGLGAAKQTGGNQHCCLMFDKPDDGCVVLPQNH